MNRLVSFAIGAGVLGAVALVCWGAFRGDAEAMVPAPEPPPPPVAAPPDRAADARFVNGVVLRDDGRPAPGAHVVLSRMRSAWPEWRREPVPGDDVRTGADGSFRFRTERQPQLLIEYDHPQYAGDLVEVPVLVERLELRLHTGYALEGRVLDRSGQPLSHVRVALEPTLADARCSLPAVVSEAGGAYRFANVIAGMMRVVARHEQWQPVSVQTLVGAGRARDLSFEQAALALTGKVVEAGTETPVADAEVLVLAAGQQFGRSDAAAARSNAAGEFQLNGLPRANLRFQVRHPRFGIASRTLAVGEQADDLRFELAPSSAVSGRLVAPDGMSVAGARLLLRSAADELGQAVVADDGSFRFATTFTPGVAVIAGAAGRFAFADSGAATMQVHIDDGHDARFEFSVTPPAVIAGRVLDEAGRPLAGARLTVVQTDLMRDRLLQAGAALWERNLQKLTDPFTRSAGGEAEQLLAVTDADGAFRIAGMLPGPLALRVQHAGHGTRQVSFEVPATGTVRDDLDVRMATGCRIAGRVRRGGAPLPGAQVDVKAEGMAIYAVTDINGDYQLRDLPPGSYRVRARFASLTVNAQAPEVDPGHPAGVDLEFPAARVITGTVLDDKNQQPVEGATVMLLGEEANRQTTDAEGRFQIDCENASGAVVLQVVYGDRSAPTRRRVPAGRDKVTINVPTPALVTVRANLFGLPGRKRLPGVLVRAAARDAGIESPPAKWVELSGGALRHPLLPVGRWRLQLWSEGYAPFVQDVEARQGEDVRLGEVLLEPGCELRGRLVDGAGRAVAGAEVFLGDEQDLGRFPLRGRSDADGAFTVSGVSTAAANLVVRARGYAVASARVRLPQDVLGGTPFTVHLQRGATVRVHVERATDNVVLLTRGARVVDSREIDETGLAVFEHMAPGDYEALLPSGSGPAPFRIAPGAETVDVRLQ